MRKKGNLYKYITVYVDDLAIAMKDAKELTDILEKQHKFKLKGTGPISFHLGMDFTRDNDKTLCISPTMYIDKLVKHYEKTLGMKPNTSVTSPLEKGDHPELNTSDLCTTEPIAQYQSMIGALQWIVTIRRFDINTAVMTMSGFRIAPRVGHPATVEAATYGSEFVAARVCVEQIIDLRNTLRFLGVLVREKSYRFGHNKSVVDSSMQRNAKLHKCHTILSFHCVREAIAAGILGFYFLQGDDNPADILSKHWGYTQIKDRL
jgi:Reverse transcriptase (RNA-dependent DNA polymerase)